MDGRNLEWASAELESDRDLVLVARHAEDDCGGSETFRFASAELRNDPYFKELVGNQLVFLTLVKAVFAVPLSRSPPSCLANEEAAAWLRLFRR